MLISFSYYIKLRPISHHFQNITVKFFAVPKGCLSLTYSFGMNPLIAKFGLQKLQRAFCGKVQSIFWHLYPFRRDSHVTDRRTFIHVPVASFRSSFWTQTVHGQWCLGCSTWPINPLNSVWLAQILICNHSSSGVLWMQDYRSLCM